jgi:hypothetical protein
VEALADGDMAGRIKRDLLCQLMVTVVVVGPVPVSVSVSRSQLEGRLDNGQDARVVVGAVQQV